MPKMYRIVGGASYTWEYVNAKKPTGDRDPEDMVLATSMESWQSEQAAENAIKEMKEKRVKRMGDRP